MYHATFAPPDLTVFCRLDEIGLDAVGQRLEPDRALLECRVAEPDPWCRGCGSQAISRGTDARLLEHEPFGHHPTTLLVRVRQYACVGCGRSWREDLTQAAPPRAKLSRGGMRWALEATVLDHLTVLRAAVSLGVSWHTANTAILAEGKRRLIDVPGRFDGVRVLGVDDSPARFAPYGRCPHCMAAHPPRRQGRDRDHRPDTGPREDGAGQAAGHGRRTLESGVHDLARRSTAGLAGRRRGRRDGRVQRVQEGRRRGAARGGDGDGSLPRREVGW